MDYGLSYAIKPIGFGEAAVQVPRSHSYGQHLGVACLLAYSCFFDRVALLGISVSVMAGSCDWPDTRAILVLYNQTSLCKHY
jgi:hypothetical protein